MPFPRGWTEKCCVVDQMKAMQLFCILLACPALWSATTRNVGPGQKYKTPCAAIRAAHSGDTILIDAAGNYDGDVCSIPQDRLTLRGINGRPHIDAEQRSAAGKGTWVVDGNDVTIDNIEFSGSSAPGGNGAGIRAEGGNITIRNCYFHDNQDGVLTANLRKGEVLIEYSEFARNGRFNGYTHNIYVGEQAKFTMRFCYSHDSNGGQLVKTRAAENYILYNRLTGESGASNYELDVPNGGRTYVIGNIIQQGPRSTNSNMLAYLLEGKDSFEKDLHLYVINNTFVNDMARGTFINIGKDAAAAVIENNIFSGPGDLCTQSQAALSHNFTGDPQFVDAAKYDYRLKPGSPAIAAGLAPGSVSGQSLLPDYEYLHPCCGETRTVAKALDIGAYAYAGVKGMPAKCVKLEK